MKTILCIAAVLISQPVAAKDMESVPVVKAWRMLDNRCRGEYLPERAHDRVCARRDAAKDRMYARGYCYGEIGQANYQYRVHRCGPRSNRPE